MTLKGPLSVRVERLDRSEFTNGAEPSNPVSQLSSDWFSGDLLETLPAAVYVCDADAVVVAYNRRASELWGRSPSPGDTDEKYCGAHKLFRLNGAVLQHRWRLFSEQESRSGYGGCDRATGSLANYRTRQYRAPLRH
jgi:PAS domain-containing protein